MSALASPGGVFIAGGWCPGSGPPLTSWDPDDGSVVWAGNRAGVDQVDAALSAAASAGRDWRRMDLDARFTVIEGFTAQLRDHRREMVELISRENGKPHWDADGEVAALLGKVEVSLQAFRDRSSNSSRSLGRCTVETTHRPHGPMVVMGPFNFPLLLPGGHIIPALLAGNTVVFKPSEQTPAVAAATVWLWERAGLPPGVLGLVHGGVDIANALMDHPATRGVLFTGGTLAGAAIRRRLVDRPEVITALELGGNNPLVVWEVRDVDTAARLAVRSAFVSSGQRCLCSRRLIVSEGRDGEDLVDAVVALADRLRTGPPSLRPEPFNGPLISADAARQVLDAQEDLIVRGATVLLEARHVAGLGPSYLTPGILDVTEVLDRPDREVFGPLLCVVRVPDFDAALHEATSSRFGLAATLIADDESLFDRFRGEVDAGLINYNTASVQASGWAPFGGSGWSGNHRPAGYFAADYCSWPVATVRETTPIDDTPLPGVDDDARS